MAKATWKLRNIKTEEILDISKSVFKVGRSVNADLTSVNSVLSRNHATLSILIDGFLYIQDNKSSNGSFVNNQKIPVMEMKLLNHGDIIGFGCCQETREDENFELPPLIFEILKNDGDTLNTKISEEENHKATVNLPSAGFSKDSTDYIVISDGEDDEDPFTNSQIYKLSEVIKKEQTSLDESIDPYLHIKQELAELDYCDNLQGVVDLTSDLEHFNSTHDLLNILESPIHGNNSLVQGCSSSIPLKPKYIKPPIVEPHFLSKVKSNENNKSLEQNDNVKATESTSKRKSADTGQKVIKKSKTNCNFVESKCDKKSINEEFKKRNKAKSGTTFKKETEKESKQTILTERKKRLKEISEKDSNKTCSEPVIKTSKPTSKIKISSGRGDFLLEGTGKVSTTTRSENYTIDSVPSTAKCLPEGIVGLGNCTDSTNKECNEVISHVQKDCENEQIIQDTTISSNFSPKSDTNNLQMPNSLTVVHKTPSIHNPEYKCNEQRHGFIWKTPTNYYRPTVSSINRNINIDDVLSIIVSWSVNWLREQNNSDISPPVNGEKQLVKLPLFYESFSCYYNIVTPLIILEMWQYVYQTFCNKDEERSPIRIVLNHTRIVGELIYLDGECYISEEDVKKKNIFRIDDFAVIEMRLKDTTSYYVYNIFGYIKFCRRTVLTDDTIINNEIAELCPNIPHTNLQFTVVTKNLSDKVIVGKKAVIKVIANVASYLRLIKTVKCLNTSSICKQVLNPSIENYNVPWEDNSNLIVEVNLNSQQKKIVLEACSVCLRSNPGLYLIKGPPGTGKSTVIINIVLQILLSSKNDGKSPLILLTAPSNAAVDNLILKLSEARTKLSGCQKKILKLVRIGPDSSISKDVDKFKLNSLARNHILKSRGLTTLEEYKVALERGLDIESFLKKHLGQKYFYEMRCAEDALLFGSNVLCTTLNSCVSSRIMDCCKRDQLKFSCCIIDEATQCSEAESLLPVQLGIDKFILVGDPQQLPAVVCNKDAQKLGYGRSLFSRIDENFKKYENNPIKMLYEQYRMDPEICEYPNNTFYEGKLKSFPIHTNKIAPKLRPYLLFNLMGTGIQDTYDSGYQNSEEALLIYSILHTLQKCIQSNCKYSLGIITPYRAQKQLLIRQISNIRFNSNVSVTVNTVDSFQGMENDVIIISCVRYNPNYFLQNEQRLNVAITRAKQALYIIGNYTLFKHCRLLYDLREDAKKRKLCIDISQDPRNVTNLHRLLLQR